MGDVALIAINLYYNDVDKNILLNRNLTPIMYYWNEEDNKSLVDSIINNEKINNLIREKVANINIYSTTKISYIHYTLLGQSENFLENTINLQDVIRIDKFGNIIDSTLNDIAKQIYFEVFNAEYVERNDDPIIYDVYAKTSLINKQQLSLSTFLNYFRSVVSKKYSLTKENIDILYDTAAYIIDKTQKYYEHV